MEPNEPSVSEWASPIVVVKKKDGDSRLCVDYRQLNAVTFMDAYPKPRTDELLDRLGKAKYITTSLGILANTMMSEKTRKNSFHNTKGFVLVSSDAIWTEWSTVYCLLFKGR